MKNKPHNWSFSLIFIVVLSISSIFLFGYKLTKNKTPNEYYTVYLDGEKIGIVSSKEEFNNYINNQEEKLKKQYNVDEIYIPKGVEIKKTITYNNKTNTNEEIYKRLVSSENFTIKGVVIEITKTRAEEDEKDEVLTINLLNKEMFDEAIVEIIKAFIDDEEYEAFMNASQQPIIDTGEIIEDIYIKEEVTYKESYIPTNEKIFTDIDELKMYLMYGTTDKPNTYIVKDGDTIETIAQNNMLNVQEFLIANPEFTSANNLLYESQEVVVGLINPLLSIVVEKHSVQEEVQNFTTEIKYDDELIIGYSRVEREGENGIDKVTRKYQYINGQVADVALVGSVEVKPSVSKILVKGDKYVPNVADLSYWAWPTSRPYTITSRFAPRWGSFHRAIDIYVGHGAPLYAVNNGTVVGVGKGCVRGDLKCYNTKGNYVVINHNAGNYYTRYMHLNDVYVELGQTVARGQKIGTMGNTGRVVPSPPYGSSSLAGTHLHFEVWIGAPGVGKAVDPLATIFR